MTGARRQIAALLPLSGPYASIGQPMLQAVQLALSQGGLPVIPADTAGNPQGAVAALQGVLGSGVGIVLGPLLGSETDAIAPVAASAGVPVLAFTNTPDAARPGVWTLGITPAQQVDRVVRYAQAQGRSRFAAFLPDTQFGRALGTAFTNSLARNGLSPAGVQFHGPGMSAISSGLRQLSDFEGRWGNIQSQIRQLRRQNSAEAHHQAEELTRTPPPPPPFDALLLGDTGEAAAEIAPLLSYYFVSAPQVQIMGPALWAAPNSGSRGFRGAIYAAPDPGARSSFVDAFTGRYGAPPPGPADLAYDAAEIALQTAPAGYALQALTNPAGFQGTDGWLRLLPDGQVQRALAVFQIQGGGPQIVSPPAPPVG
jgi:ABC-type branched-subunit amino acid transport system substrate-binding protein